MRVWVDMSAPAHVLVLRPIIERLRAQGHTVEITSRDYAQTQALLDLHGMPHTPIGRHGGASRVRKAYRLGARTAGMIGFGRGRTFDLALAHGSNDLAIASRALGIPEANMHDYEYAVTQHHIGCRLAKRVMFPESVPPERLRRFGVGPDKLFAYPGIKEEYYLFDFEPDPGAMERLAVDTSRVVVVVRPPPDVSLYHRKSNPLFPKVLTRLGQDDEVHAIVMPRTQTQREFIETMELPSLIVPPGAVEAQSLIAQADLVVSAGGTMNREAAALGTPGLHHLRGTARRGRRRADPLRPVAAADRPPRTAARKALLRSDSDEAGPRLPRREDPRHRRRLAIARRTTPRPDLLGESEETRARLQHFIDLAGDGESRPIDSVLRALDVLISAAILIVLAPILALTAAAIFLSSGRPVFYRGARVGRAGQLFWMYKFRTLAPDAESRLGPYLGEELSRRTEEEVTRIGRALRTIHLDEVPQLWNVLRGDMAVVGPRPIRPAFFTELCEEIPQYWQRLVVRPGVTGFAQTRVTREESWANKLAHDMEYIADRSVPLYVSVLFATVTKVAGRGPAAPA